MNRKQAELHNAERRAQYLGVDVAEYLREHIKGNKLCPKCRAYFPFAEFDRGFQQLHRYCLECTGITQTAEVKLRMRNKRKCGWCGRAGASVDVTIERQSFAVHPSCGERAKAWEAGKPEHDPVFK